VVRCLLRRAACRSASLPVARKLELELATRETIVSNTEDNPSSTSRRLAMTSGAALLGTTIIGGMSANAQPAGTPASAPPAGAMPQGYNILFMLVDQEHFFPKWPFPVPAREAIKKKSVTFLNHQAASCVCSSARSVVYTGQHIQHTGTADNLNYVWQRSRSGPLPCTTSTCCPSRTRSGRR
jgi:hypothetical protein